MKSPLPTRALIFILSLGMGLSTLASAGLFDCFSADCISDVARKVVEKAAAKDPYQEEVSIDDLYTYRFTWNGVEMMNTKDGRKPIQEYFSQGTTYFIHVGELLDLRIKYRDGHYLVEQVLARPIEANFVKITFKVREISAPWSKGYLRFYEGAVVSINGSILEYSRPHSSSSSADKAKSLIYSYANFPSFIEELNHLEDRGAKLDFLAEWNGDLTLEQLETVMDAFHSAAYQEMAGNRLFPHFKKIGSKNLLHLFVDKYAMSPLAVLSMLIKNGFSQDKVREGLSDEAKTMLWGSAATPREKLQVVNFVFSDVKKIPEDSQIMLLQACASLKGTELLETLERFGFEAGRNLTFAEVEKMFRGVEDFDKARLAKALHLKKRDWQGGELVRLINRVDSFYKASLIAALANASCLPSDNVVSILANTGGFEKETVLKALRGFSWEIKFNDLLRILDSSGSNDISQGALLKLLLPMKGGPRLRKLSRDEQRQLILRTQHNIFSRDIGKSLAGAGYIAE